MKVEWFIYNTGPSAMEAIFADSIGLTYVGPSPAINAYAKVRGEDIRIVAGAAEGGAALVVQPDAGLRTPADFRAKKIATPQLGNTQVIPTADPDQLTLFQGRQLDAVWTVELWVSRLETEAGGQVLVEEADSVITVLVTGARILGSKRDVVRRIVAAHEGLTAWIQAHPDEAQAAALEALERFAAKAREAGFLRSAPNLSRLVERA